MPRLTNTSPFTRDTKEQNISAKALSICLSHLPFFSPTNVTPQNKTHNTHIGWGVLFIYITEYINTYIFFSFFLLFLLFFFLFFLKDVWHSRLHMQRFLTLKHTLDSAAHLNQVSKCYFLCFQLVNEREHLENQENYSNIYTQKTKE